MDRWQYLIILAACLAITLPLEIFGAGVYRQAWRALRAVLPVAAAFVLWDEVAIGAHVWTYNRAYITGVDIREPLSTEDRDAIRKAWLDNLVLRFRGAPMTDAQHMAFTRQFGELEFNPAKLIEMKYGVNTQTDGRKSEVPPEISVISNIIEDGKAIGGLGDAQPAPHRRAAEGRQSSDFQ